MGLERCHGSPGNYCHLEHETVAELLDVTKKKKKERKTGREGRRKEGTYFNKTSIKISLLWKFAMVQMDSAQL